MKNIGKLKEFLSLFPQTQQIYIGSLWAFQYIKSTLSFTIIIVQTKSCTQSPHLLHIYTSSWERRLLISAGMAIVMIHAQP